MERIINIQNTIRKGGQKGDRMWRTHRLEGVVKNKAIKPQKKQKKSL